MLLCAHYLDFLNNWRSSFYNECETLYCFVLRYKWIRNVFTVYSCTIENMVAFLDSLDWVFFYIQFSQLEIRSRFANKNKNRCDDWFTVFYKLFDWLKSVLSFWKILEVLNLKFKTLSSSMSAHLEIFARISNCVAS